ncbi:hypothetical protein Tco_0240582 [Tanacetum coccineum]
MGDANPIRTLGDYSRPSHEGYRNTIELPVGNNVVRLQSDPSDWEERTRGLFNFPFLPISSYWSFLIRLPEDPHHSWEDLTLVSLLHSFTVKELKKTRNDFLMFQQLSWNTVMSDSEDSTVTYTVVSSPFADLPDIGSPGVDGPPVMPEDPYAYVVAAFQAPPSPDYVFVPEPVYPEFMPPEDEVLPAEEQPLPAAPLNPTTNSPGYVPNKRMIHRDETRIMKIDIEGDKG